jgi:hypothetical protein
LQNHCKIIAFCNLLLFTLPLALSAQNKEKEEANKEMSKKLATLDLSTLKSDFLLNKGVFTETEFAVFRTKPRNKQGQIVMTTTAEEWQNLYERVVGADLRAKGRGRLPDFEEFAEKNRAKQAKNNVIPIGILSVDAVLMTKAQLEENAKQKENKQKVNTDSYEKIPIVYASVLQEDVYQAEVSFRISSVFHLGGGKNNIRRVELDFQDGKGFQSYPLNERQINHRFEAIGERVLTIRLITERGPYIFYSKLNVRQLKRPEILREFEVSAQAVRQDTVVKKISKAGRLSAINVVGANVRIIKSCDQIFDKPIIIAEGFDVGQDVGLDQMGATYIPSLDFLITRGYDLVFVDYWDARTHIENNAQVLKQVIREVNATKTYNEKLIVMGVSMSGLVARWALREMENAGENHNVKLYMSFDSPHQGANVPPSIINLYWEASPTLMVNVIYPLLPKGWRDLYESLQTPAARQMLLHYSSRLSQPVGRPHPEFESFQNSLRALGNNGYPQQCRNIAITNGSFNGSDRSLFNNYNYGSNIINSTTPYILQNTFIEAYTNQISSNGLILNFIASGILSTSAATVTYGSNFNDDFLPGGRSGFPIPQRLRPLENINLFGINIIPDTPIKRFEFCFVPTFSSIDYQGDRGSQFAREYLNVFGTNQHPFAAIYGNGALDRNRIHVTPWNTNWGAMAQNEGLLTPMVVCPIPMTPFFTSNQPVSSCLPNNQNLTFTLANTGDMSNYAHRWLLQPGGLYIDGSIFSINTNQLLPNTQYTLTCTRRFMDQNYSTATTSYSMIFSVCDNGSGGGNPCQFNEGDFVYLMSNNQNAFARFHNGTLYAATDNGTFVSRNELTTNGMPTTFSNCFAETDPRGGGGSNLPFQNGCYTLTSKLSNKKMQMDNDGNGARVRQYPANGQNNQIFKLESVDGDAYKIMAATSNRTIEAPNGNTGYGTELYLTKLGLQE